MRDVGHERGYDNRVRCRYDVRLHERCHLSATEIKINSLYIEDIPLRVNARSVECPRNWTETGFVWRPLCLVSHIT